MQLAEADILEKLEKMCDPDAEAGEWIAHYDLVESGDVLKVQDMGQVSPEHAQQNGSMNSMHGM